MVVGRRVQLGRSQNFNSISREMGEEMPNIGILEFYCLRHNFSQISRNHTTSCPISMKIGMDVSQGKVNHL